MFSKDNIVASITGICAINALKTAVEVMGDAVDKLPVKENKE